jgi:type VI secretion system (T6SS) baseplate-like injector VgrG
MSGAFSGAGLRDMLRDERVWCVLARVAVHEGESTHFEVNDDGDLEVTVLTHQHEVAIRALLGAGVAGKGRGTWAVPDVGTEVMLAFADGEFEGDAVVVAVLPSRDTPASVTAGRTLIKDADIRGEGGTVITLSAPEVRIGGDAPVEPTIKGTTYRSAEDTMLTVLGALTLALNTVHGGAGAYPDPTTAAAALAAANAINTFLLGAGGYLTTNARVK